MKTKYISIVSLVVGTLFAFLFYKNSQGLNLLIFNLLLIGTTLYIHKPRTNKLFWVVLSGQFLSALAVVYHASIFSIAVNWFSLVFVQVYAQGWSFKSSFYGLRAGMLNLIKSPHSAAVSLGELAGSGGVGIPVLRYSKLLFIPLVIVFVFTSIYAKANIQFGNTTNKILDGFGRYFGDFFLQINFSFLLVLLTGICLGAWYLVKFDESTLYQKDSKSSDLLSRVKRKYRSKVLSKKLLNEYKSGLLLLVTLNIILAYANYLDIYYVWFGFEWDGGTLKQFVHEGTYLLIISILISIGVTLYYFRGNINFFKDNKTIKLLAYIWILQNAILVISVGFRNYWYIEHFALAYKRIGVMFFLLLCMYGLFSVYMKVKEVKSSFYLFRVNTLAFYVLLITMSSIDWDTVIVKYNLAHSNIAFVHFDYLSSMDQKTLPYLDMTKEKLEKLYTIKEANFGFDKNDISSEYYLELIETRKNYFMEDFKERNWLEWNYKDWRAFNMLK